MKSPRPAPKSASKPSRVRSTAPRASVQAGKERVFLGGTCGETTWRKPFISLLEKAGTPYFNPQLAKGVEWKTEHAVREKSELLKATIVVMVITNDTTGIVSLLELSELFTKFNLSSNKKSLLAHVESPGRAGARDSTGKDRLRAIEFLKQRIDPPRTLLLGSEKEVLDALKQRLKRRS
jgi:hypothetical protein